MSWPPPWPTSRTGRRSSSTTWSADGYYFTVDRKKEDELPKGPTGKVLKREIKLDP